MWDDIKTRRETSYAKKRAETTERYNVGTRSLPPLSVGDSVSIQNKRGSNPTLWERTGQVVERLEHRQYLVKCDGSGNVLLRTRTHLRKIHPATRNGSHIMGDFPQIQHDQPDPPDRPLLIPGTLHNGSRVIDPVDTELLEDHPPEALDTLNGPLENTPPPALDAPPTPHPHAVATPSTQSTTRPTARQVASPPVPSTVLRRGARNRNAPTRLSPTMKGKFHGTTS